MLANPRECRVHARRCAEWAAKTKNQALQRKLSDLARTWDQLAIQLEESHALLEQIDQGGNHQDKGHPTRLQARHA
jgi:hypothetical protein